MTTAKVIDMEAHSAQNSKITHNVVVVDREMAQRWLGKNLHNRKVRAARVGQYQRDMIEGRWLFAGDPIRFDTNEVLLDGQHRLLALAGSPTPLAVPFLVIRGLPPEAQAAMDQGSKRTAGDQLGMRGVKNAVNVGAAVKLFITWERGLLFRDFKIAHAQISTPLIEEWVVDHAAEVERLQDSLHHIRSSDSRPSVGGAACLIFDRLDSEATREFFRLLATGAGTEGHPINALDQRLRRMRKQQVAVTEREGLALHIQAWNAWRGGRQLTRFQRPKGGNWTVNNFPEPR